LGLAATASLGTLNLWICKNCDENFVKALQFSFTIRKVMTHLCFGAFLKNVAMLKLRA
jgi:hypothetical protein